MSDDADWEHVLETVSHGQRVIVLQPGNLEETMQVHWTGNTESDQDSDTARLLSCTTVNVRMTKNR